MTFMLGGDHTVHLKACRNQPEDAVPYITIPKTPFDMLGWLTRDDVKDGHSERPRVKPCPDCIEGNL